MVRKLASFALLVSLPCDALVAQEPGPPPSPLPPPARTAPTPARSAPTFESLHLEASELPKDWALETELAAASPQAATLLDGSALGEAAAAVKRKDFQTLGGPSGRGSILFLEFEPQVPNGVMASIRRTLWGDERGATRQRPELFARAGNVVIVLSFPVVSSMRDWTCARMRRRFGVRLPFQPEDVRPLLQPVYKQYASANAEGGLQLLRGAQARLAEVSLAAWLEGEFCRMKEDWAGALRGYTRAIELDATVDPFPDEQIAWAVTDGRGFALVGMKKHDEAAAAFQAAADVAASFGDPEREGASIYNVACCRALCGQLDAVLDLLRRSFELDPDLKRHAQSDPDLAALRSDPKFQELLK